MRSSGFPARNRLLLATLCAPTSLALDRDGMANEELAWDSTAGSHVAAPGGRAFLTAPPTPTIVADPGWASFIGMPDLSLGPFGNASFNTPHMQPVDFGVWQASDGSWQLQSCIRNTCQTGCDSEGKALHWNHSRLFYRWESVVTNVSSFPSNAADWKPVGVVMIGEPEYGEDIGGLQAPHVTRWGDPPLYHMFCEYLHRRSSQSTAPLPRNLLWRNGRPLNVPAGVATHRWYVVVDLSGDFD